MSHSTSKHYDARYFAWQAAIGEFGGWANLPKFAPYVSESDDVLDFGCGGGFLLRNLRCRRRVGVEVNSVAAALARENNIEVYARVQDVPDNYVDVVISNHALEHTFHPLQELMAIHPKLRTGGKIVFFVPCESILLRYRPDDINHHLYSWSPMCLGNLFMEAGYSLVESVAYIHRWPPGYRQIARIGGRSLFELACRIYGRLELSWFQVRVVAEKRSVGGEPG